MRTLRRRRRVAWLFCLLLVLCAARTARAAGEYRTVEVESLRITIDSEWGGRTTPGYLPVRFDITNLGEPRVIEIAGQGSRFIRASRMGWQGRMNVQQFVRLARGDRVRLTIPVPVFADSESVRFEIREDGRTLERFNYSGFTSRSSPDDAAALIVADAGTAFGRAAPGWRRMVIGGMSSPRIIVAPGSATAAPPTGGSSGSVASRGPSQPLDIVLHPARLPTNWLGYTSMRAVIIGPAEWGQLNDAQKNALLTWIACGGDLFLVDGDLSTILSDRPAPSGAAPAPAVKAYFFGRIHRQASKTIDAAGLADVLTKAGALQDSNWALPVNRARDWGVIAERGFRLPIPGVGRVPARAYFSILLAFAAVVGPLNYWFLRRRGKQVLLVLTAPIVSGVFILLLAGYVLAGEGIGVRGRAVTFTMLDQVRRQAATRATMSLYAAGMTPPGGLRYARDQAVFAIGPDGMGARDQMELDLTESQRFPSGLIQARAPANLEVIGFRTARERLTFSREAGGLTVTNGLGATITALIYREGHTVYTLAGPLQPGAKRTVAGAGLVPALGAEIVPKGLPLTQRLEHLIDHLPEGAYVAVLEHSPFWAPGLERVSERDSFHVVFGWVSGQP